LYNDREYRQDDKPLVEQLRGQGHAVRATYVYNAMTDIATMLRDPAYGRAVDRLWQDVYSKRAYVTGGLGSISGTEAFGDDYVLPNRSAYTETCASVGAVLWNHRMFLRTGDAKYLDAFEQTLYNGLLSGVSVTGNSFFYRNPLEATAMSVNNTRQPYFDVACCPANLSRLLAQLPGLVYSQRGNEVFVNLYMDSEATVALDGGTVKIKQTTNYPWDGSVRISVTMDRPVRFTLKLRRPGWLGAGPFATTLYQYAAASTAQVTGGIGAKAGLPAAVGGWINVPVAEAIPETAALSVVFPMPVRRVVAHAGLKEGEGKTAVQRGPVLYCLEAIDNGGEVLSATLPMTATLTPALQPNVLGGIMNLTTSLPAAAGAPAKTLTAIPYFAWANRGRGEMVVWIKRQP
jgi:DUF1680 family protein